MSEHDPGGRLKPRWTAGSVITARFSDCGLYRYMLQETWNTGQPAVMFLLMNPSVAGIEHADPTLIRTGRFARAWGFGCQLIANVHAYRITDSRKLRAVADPVGQENDFWIGQMATGASMVVLAYGLPPKALRPRAAQVVQMLTDRGCDLRYLQLCGDGTPKHPLYLPADLQPKPWTTPRPPGE